MPHPKNKQDKNTNPVHQQTRLPPHEVLPIREEKKKTKLTPFIRVQTKVTPKRSLNKPVAQPYTPRAETKRKKEFDLKAREKETSNAIMGKEKRQKNIAPMKKQTRSTKDQRGKKRGGCGGEDRQNT